MTAIRPPGRSISNAAGRPTSSDSSSWFTSIRSAWNTRFAGCPSPKRAGAGIDALHDVDELPRALDRRVGSRRRTMPRAIWRA